MRELLAAVAIVIAMLGAAGNWYAADDDPGFCPVGWSDVECGA